MTQEEFERWIGNPFMLNKLNCPAAWKGTKDEIAAWEHNPYEHPYTRGAYELLHHLEKTK